MPPLIAPSFLSANFANLRHDIEMVNQSQADWFHLDIMDGVFVPNISFGFPVIEAIKRLAKKPLDVHLMITTPDRYIKRFKEAGADILSVHYEEATHLNRTLAEIRKAEMLPGIVLNPHTPISLLEDSVADAGMILLMSVNPGFGGQLFLEHIYQKTAKLKELILRKNPSCLIEVDGGVDLDNAQKLVDAGADVLVCGNSIFGSHDPVAAISALKRIAAA
ncbi:MAG TPA: ribulose-phosphate 3-epimerase [Bacteroidales bacterium]|nr:ribulose-phosphate 3-epimerase [Bacteroidales bacterium]